MRTEPPKPGYGTFNWNTVGAQVFIRAIEAGLKDVPGIPTVVQKLKKKKERKKERKKRCT